MSGKAGKALSYDWAPGTLGGATKRRTLGRGEREGGNERRYQPYMRRLLLGSGKMCDDNRIKVEYVNYLEGMDRDRRICHALEGACFAWR